MDKQLEDRIKELGEILNKRMEKDFPVYAEEKYRGHIYGKKLVKYERRGDFLHSKAERKRALKELKYLKRNSLDEQARKEVARHINWRNYILMEEQIKPVAILATLATAFIILPITCTYLIYGGDVKRREFWRQNYFQSIEKNKTQENDSNDIYKKIKGLDKNESINN